MRSYERRFTPSLSLQNIFPSLDLQFSKQDICIFRACIKKRQCWVSGWGSEYYRFSQSTLAQLYPELMFNLTYVSIPTERRLKNRPAVIFCGASDQDLVSFIIHYHFKVEACHF